MLKGGCLCGAIRYEAAGVPFHETVCHCPTCRRAAGAPLVAWFSIPRSGLRYVRGTPVHYRSSAKVSRGFCGRCGTQLTYEHDDLPAELDITTASLDHPEHVPPRDHTHTSTQLPWLRIADGLQQYPGLRTPP